MEAFRWAKAVLGDPTLFPRHADVTALVGCIQQDETPHVGYLGTALAELRCRTLAGCEDGPVSGREVIDRARDMVVAFQTGPRHQANIEFRTQVVERGRYALQSGDPLRSPPTTPPAFRNESCSRMADRRVSATSAKGRASATR